VKKERKGSGLLQNEAIKRQRLLKTAEYLNTKYTEDRFVNIVKVKKAIKNMK
jgi:hypothetical protein